MKALAMILLCSLAVINSSPAQDSFPFQNQELDREARINDLISRLTTDEKISLMVFTSPAIERLGIPEYNWWNESLHGVARAGQATVFPQAIALAATFDTNLLYRVATAISDEARAKYNAFQKKGVRQQYAGLTFWSPNVNIFRDPRWGRGQETYGEDPYLTSQMGRNYVLALQGDDENYLKAAACAKHFAVHSGPEESRHSFNAKPDEFDLYDTYLPAFKVLSDAGVEAFMCAYNQVNDHPCCANDFLINEILRGKWGFKGHIVSDCWAISDFVKFQDYSETEAEAAAAALLAGVNLNCGSTYPFLTEALEQKLITEEDIDNALKPLLRTRFKLGMFDKTGSTPYDNIPPEIINNQEHIDLAREAAQKSIVLLTNKDNALPLDRKEVHKLFVTGPLAADNMALLGNYNGFSSNLVSPLEGIIGQAGADVVIDYSMGTQLTKSDKFHGFFQAQGADAAIVFLGFNLLLEGEDGDAMLSDHGGDRVHIELPENQIELVRRLREETDVKKLIVVISGGSAIACPEITELADAVLFNWYPGEQGGNAIADILFGDANPSGRLPLTFYKSTDDLPAFDDYSMKNRTYRYYKGDVLFPFGHGLSYSTFDYGKAKYEVDEKCDLIRLKLDIQNTSDKDGTEIVQVYARPEEDNPSGLNKKLVAFCPVAIKAGQKETLDIEIPLENLRIYDVDSETYKLPKGKAALQIGSSSERIKEELQIGL